MSDAVMPIPAGQEGLIPNLVCERCAEALDFYTRGLGAIETSRIPSPDGRIMHASMKIGESIFFLADDFPEYCGGKSSSPLALKGTPVTLHRYVKDCDAAIAQAEAAGATVTMAAMDMFWGDRYGQVTDPFGHIWAFATHLKELTPEELQANMAEAFSHPPA